MRKVSIRELRANLAKELDNLPFEIVKRGKVIAKCTQDNLNAVPRVHKEQGTIQPDRIEGDRVIYKIPFRPYSKEQQTGKGGK